MASIKDIAKLANVSVSTVSRVINSSGYVSADAKKKIIDAIQELDYHPSAIARSMVTKQSNTIGLMIPHINSPFFSGLAVSIEEEARKLGYNVLLCHTNEETEVERDTLRVLTERRVDGIIVTPVGKEFSHFEKIAENTPCVFVGRTTEEIEVNGVEVENSLGSSQVIEHLIQVGHKNIGVINGPLYLSTGQQRWEGVKNTLEKYNLYYPEYVREGDFSIKGGYYQALKLLSLENRPTAIFAANHLTVLGVLKAVNELKLSIPHDIAIASFEGLEDSEWDFIVQPKITANIHPTAEMSRIAVTIIHKNIMNKLKGHPINNKDNKVIKMQFVERESTLGEHVETNHIKE